MNTLYKNNLLIIIALLTGWLGFEFLFCTIARDAEKAYEVELVKQAKTYVETIQKTREWHRELGDLYSRNSKLKPNLYLAENVLKTDKGEFIKINPSWMTRMLSQAGTNDSLNYSLVSNRPLNPINKAEGFAAESLRKAVGKKQAQSAYMIDKKEERLHFIEPIYMSENCMKCHMREDLKVGSLIGGIEVDIDAGFILHRIDKAWMNFYLVSLLFTLAIALIYFFIHKLDHQKSKYIQRNIELKKKLEEHIRKLNQTLEASELGYWHWNIQTGEHTVDKQWLKILGFREEDIEGRENDWSERIHVDDRANVKATIDKALKNKEHYSVEFRMRHSDGSYVWIQGSGGITSFDNKGEVLALSGTHLDITPRKTLEIKNRDKSSYLNTLFENNPNIIIVTDGVEIIKANSSFFRLFSEYNSLEMFKLEHQCICDFFEHKKGDDFITNEHGKWIEETLSLSEPIANIYHLGHHHYYTVNAKKVYHENSMKMLVTFSDITETYKLRKRFEELSVVDELTQAYNRRYFNKIYKDELNRAKRESKSFSFMILDIDNFKLYNDHYGHDEGDEALKSLSLEIRKSIQRSNEFFFRLGGEEFGVIFSAESKQEAVAYAQKICSSIEALNIKHSYNRPYEKLTISIGVSYTDEKGTCEAKDIYRKADRALYEAKNSGRNRVKLYGEES